MPGPRSLRYMGGKRLLADWIAAQLPRNPMYVEPCAGLLGVLLARPRVDCEIVNDLDRDVHNWWTCVRDRPDELAARLAATPYSRSEFYAAEESVARLGCDPPDVDRAAAFATICMQQKYARLSHTLWQYPSPGGVGTWRRMPARIRPLAERLHGVALLNDGAETVIRQYAGDPDTTIYVDPPYPGDDPRTKYRHHIDRAKFVAVLTAPAVRAAVAVSGFDGSWPELTAAGWHRTRATRRNVLSDHAGRTHVETLWTNYPPTQPALFDD